MSGPWAVGCDLIGLRTTALPRVTLVIRMLTFPLFTPFSCRYAPKSMVDTKEGQKSAGCASVAAAFLSLPVKGLCAACIGIKDVIRGPKRIPNHAGGG